MWHKYLCRYWLQTQTMAVNLRRKRGRVSTQRSPISRSLCKSEVGYGAYLPLTVTAAGSMFVKFGRDELTVNNLDDVFCSFLALSSKENKFSISNGRFEEEVLVSLLLGLSLTISHSEVCPKDTKQQGNKLTWVFLNCLVNDIVNPALK